jgi:hypothetical protein
MPEPLISFIFLSELNDMNRPAVLASCRHLKKKTFRRTLFLCLVPHSLQLEDRQPQVGSCLYWD